SSDLEGRRRATAAEKLCLSQPDCFLLGLHVRIGLRYVGGGGSSNCHGVSEGAVRASGCVALNSLEYRSHVARDRNVRHLIVHASRSDMVAVLVRVTAAYRLALPADYLTVDRVLVHVEAVRQGLHGGAAGHLQPGLPVVGALERNSRGRVALLVDSAEYDAGLRRLGGAMTGLRLAVTAYLGSVVLHKARAVVRPHGQVQVHLFLEVCQFQFTTLNGLQVKGVRHPLDGPE